MSTTMTLDELRRVAADVGELSGWDFSSSRTDRDPVPWEYEQVVRQYLTPTSRVLDIGTGGGEQFTRLAPHAGRTIAIDHSRSMMAQARKTLRPLAGVVSLALMDSRALAFVEGCFDLVLDRHAGSDAGQVARVLKPGGVFITQQVGGRYMQALFDAFGWGSNGEWWAAESRRRGDAPAGVNRLLAECSTPRGIRLNEHRELLIVAKP